jgi:preprotein translocase subunit YajC
MSTMQIILIIAAVALFIAYMARRGARKSKERKQPR